VQGDPAHALDGGDVDDLDVTCGPGARLADLRHRVDLDDVELQRVAEQVPEDLQRLANGLRPETVGEHVAAQRVDVARPHADRQLAADAVSQVALPDPAVVELGARRELGQDMLAHPQRVAVSDRLRPPAGWPFGDQRGSAVELIAELDRRLQSVERAVLAAASGTGPAHAVRCQDGAVAAAVAACLDAAQVHRR
jgi:hypothetical protein